MGKANGEIESKNKTVREWLKAIAPYLILLSILLGARRFYFEKDKEAAARYLSIIRDLGNVSNSVRSGAVITMEAYLKHDNKSYKKYREQCIYVLVNHLAVEKSSLVRATTQDVLANIGVNDDIVIEKLVTTNRHLWDQSDLTITSVISGESVSDNLQSIADTMIKILQRREPKPPDPELLTSLDMSDIYLTTDDYALSLRDVNFVNVQFERACLVRMNFENCTMGGCNLRGAHLENAILRKAKLTNVDLAESHLSGAKLDGAVLKDTDLIRADLTGAVLKEADLTEAILENAIFKKADLSGIILNNANLQEAILEDAILGKAKLKRANLHIAKLIEADLREADLRYANLTEANLGGANLHTADLQDSNIKGADLRGFLLLSIDTDKFQSYLDDSDKGIISKKLKYEFEKYGIYLSENAIIENAITPVSERDSKWLITDKDNEQTYIVKKEDWLKICKETEFEKIEYFSIDLNNFQSDLVDLDKGIISKGLQQKFEDNEIYLSKDVTCTIKKEGGVWLIDDEQTYSIEKKDGQLQIYEETKLDPIEVLSISSKEFQNVLNEGAISEKLRHKFDDNGITLSENANILIKEKDHKWLIVDKNNGQTYNVRKEEWLNVCKETKIDFTRIKEAKNWQNAIFDKDVSQKLLSQ